MRRLTTLSATVASVGAVACAATALMAAPAHAAVLSATASTISGATMTATVPVAGSPTGVSPTVYFDDTSRTYYLWPTAMPAVEYSSPDGRTWTPVAGATVPQGIDWSVVKEGPSSYRLYFASINPNKPAQVNCTNMRKELRYATSSDLVHWTTQPTVLMDDIGCGVPHVLKTRTGSYLLYWNTISTGHGVHIARSSDGLSWTTVAGPVNGDSTLVDPSPIEMPDGTFLMVAASSGGPGQAQHLRIGASPDGITWTIRPTPLYAPTPYSAFDPEVLLVDGQLRVWFSYAIGSDLMRADAHISTGDLTLAVGSAGGAASATAAAKGKPCTKKGAKSGVLVCKLSKGKLVWASR